MNTSSLTRSCLRFILLLLFLGSACASNERLVPERTIRLVTGSEHGVFFMLGDALGRVYASELPGVRVLVEPTVGSLYNVRALQEGEADLAFAISSVVYRAYTQGTDVRAGPHTKLRGMAVLHPSALQVVVRRDSGIPSIEDLQGKRVAFVAQVGGPVRGPAVEVIIEKLDLARGSLRENFLPYNEFLSELQRETLDAGIFVTSYPLSVIADAAQTIGIRLLAFDARSGANIRSEYPFFRPVVIPRSVYPSQDHDIETIGMDNLLVCRDDLDEEFVYQLTRTFFESLPDLKRVHYQAELIDPEQGPLTPIPLHPGAARYYRERELLGW